MSKKESPAHGRADHAPASKHPTPAVETAPRAEDEVLHVPKGIKRTQFFVLLVLSILTLIVFTVGDVITMLGGGGGSRTDTYMSWVHPVQGKQRLTYAEFVDEKRNLEDFFRVTRANSRDWRDQITDQNVAYLLITEQLALDSGIDVSQKELAQALIAGDGGRRFQGFGSKDMYTQFLQFSQVEPRKFERTVLRIMRVDRYEDFIGSAFAAADPKAIESAWKEFHQEYAFEAVQASFADFAAQAAAELPSAETLKAWYTDLAPEKKSELFSAHWLSEKYKAQIARVDLTGDASPTALLERYPRPEGTDLDALAKTYYDTQMHVRFRREQPLEEAPDERAKLYLPFEEVQAQCDREAQIQAAMRDWLTALDARAKAGESIDFAKDAEGLGLTVEAEESALTMEEWMSTTPDAEGKAPSGLRGPFLATAMVQAGPSGLPVAPIVESKAMALLRVVDRQQAGAPAFEAIEGPVADKWKEQKASELAMAKLRAIRDALPKASPAGAEAGADANANKLLVDEAQFAAAASAQGASVLRRDWYDPGEEARAADEQADALTKFLRFQLQTGGPVTKLEAGQVGEPVLGTDAAWLVRQAGKRDPATIRIKPSELSWLRTRAHMSGFDLAREKILNPKYYMQKYSLAFPLLKPGEAESG